LVAFLSPPSWLIKLLQDILVDSGIDTKKGSSVASLDYTSDGSQNILMQQMYYCPNCRAQVAWGQPYCTNCNAVLTWPTGQAQAQYQQNSNQQQWNQQQQGWNQQQQWNQSYTGNQMGEQEVQGQPKKTKKKEGPGLWQEILKYKGTIIKIAAGVLIVAVLIGVGNAFKDDISKAMTPPVVTSFAPSSTSVVTGTPVSLLWNVTGAQSVTIYPDIGSVSASGSKEVSPTTTTTYTLEAKNLSGSTRKLITVTVTGTLPSVGNFGFDTDSIFAGQSATLSWSVADASSVSIEPGIGPVPISGTKSVSPGANTTYTLTASNDAGNSTATAAIKVTVSNAPIITSFTVSPASILAGESATLTWDIIGATSININQGIGGVVLKGSMKVTPTATTTYTLTADSSYSSVNKTVTVNVDTSNLTTTAKTVISTSPPAIGNFTASPNAIMLGENSTLTWTVSGARTISISPDVGAVPSSGSILVIPSATTTYTLTAANSFGSKTATTSVTASTVSDGTRPVITSFTAVPPSISVGASSNLTWDIQGATTITINQGIGVPVSHFSQAVSPTVTTTYVLTALNSTGTDNRTVTVTVTP
jgi:hypothetical protein